MPFPNAMFGMLVMSLLLISPIAQTYAADASHQKLYPITKITDADSLRSGEIRIRLHGIDAPEMKQLCQDKEGRSYRCGLQARTYLVTLIGKGAELACDHLDTDRYGRLVMRCYHQGLDISAALVRSGWALAYRRYAKDYIADEREAKARKAGMHQGRFDAPWDWRRQN